MNVPRDCSIPPIPLIVEVRVDEGVLARHLGQAPLILSPRPNGSLRLDDARRHGIFEPGGERHPASEAYLVDLELYSANSSGVSAGLDGTNVRVASWEIR